MNIYFTLKKLDYFLKALANKTLATNEEACKGVSPMKERIIYCLHELT
jgi:hypothetical protein